MQLSLKLRLVLAFLIAATVAQIATIHWTGSGDGAAVTVNGGFTFRSVKSQRLLNFSGGAFFSILGGASDLKGAVSMQPGAAFYVSNDGATLLVSGDTSAEGFHVFVSGGAKASLPNLTGYNKPGGCTYFQATGAGSQIDIANLESINDGSCGRTHLQAMNGAKINAPKLTTINNGYVDVLAVTPHLQPPRHRRPHRQLHPPGLLRLHRPDQPLHQHPHRHAPQPLRPDRLD